MEGSLAYAESEPRCHLPLGFDRSLGVLFGRLYAAELFCLDLFGD